MKKKDNGHLRSFARYYAPHKKLFIADILCALVVAVCNLFYPAITKNIINIYVPSRQLEFILIWCGVLLCIFALKAGLNYFIQYWGHVLGVRIQGDMRRDMFRQIQKLPFSFFDSNKTGVLMSRLVNDLQDISELAHHGPEDVFLSLVTIIGAFIMLALINVYLSLIIMAIIPVMIFFAAKMRVSMRRTSRKTREEVGKINAGVETSVSGIRVTKAFTTEEYEQDKFDELNENFKVARAKSYKAMGIFHSGMGLITDLMYFAVLIAGGLFFYFGYIDIGEFTAYILYIAMLINPVRTLVNIFEQIQNGMTGYVRFREIMDEQPEKDAPGAAVLESAAGDVVLDAVSFGYTPGKEIIHDLSFVAESGKTTALVGPSGCGKTTVCHLLMRFYDVGGGSIRLGGQDIAGVTRESLRRNIGIVAQDVFIFDGTIKENIAYGNLDAGDADIISSARRAELHDFIMTLPDGYDTYVGERGVKLSGGQRQRISIARTFLKNPPLLILDEATSSLDNVTEASIQKSLGELSEGRTSVVVAHRLSTIEKADKIVVLDQGRLVEQGTHDQLLAAGGTYYKIYTGSK